MKHFVTVYANSLLATYVKAYFILDLKTHTRVQIEYAPRFTESRRIPGDASKSRR